jgi:hypothetical protein
LLFIVFLVAPSLSLGLSPAWLSVPNKNYWVKEENRAAAQVGVFRIPKSSRDA